MGANVYTTNQDIRDYMADHGVKQRDLAERIGVSQFAICKRLQTELTEKEKEDLIRHIDAIEADRHEAMDAAEPEEPAAPEEPADPAEPEEQPAEEPEVIADVIVGTKFKIGDRVKLPSKAERIGTVVDIWTSFAKSVCMYAVEHDDDGHCGMYAENQLEIAPIPIEYTFNTTIEDNVAVVCMIAHQGDKTWVYARGHAHILHDGAVGMAQAVSYASKRMFESLDTAQDKQIYFKGKVGKRNDH